MLTYVVWDVQRGRAVAEGQSYAQAVAIQEHLEATEGRSFIIFNLGEA